MKMLSFKTLAVLFATALTVASTSGFADKHHNKHHSSSSHGDRPIHRVCEDKKLKHEIRALKLKLAVDELGIYSGFGAVSLNSIITTWGFANPSDPLSNEKLQGSIDQNTIVINANIDLVTQSIANLGVPTSTVALINQGAKNYVSLLIDYTAAVNLNNRGGGGGDENAIATELLALAKSQAEIFAGLIGHDNENIVNVAVESTELTLQLVQAWAGVLDDSTFGAVLGDPYSQSEAAVKITVALETLGYNYRKALFLLPIFN